MEKKIIMVFLKTLKMENLVSMSMLEENNLKILILNLVTYD